MPHTTTEPPLDVQWLGPPARLWQTSQNDGDLLSQKADVLWLPDFDFVGPVLDISRVTGQHIVGFGGAFTEASALVYKGLSPERQEELLQAYFGPDGIGYTLGRTHINSCDFSRGSYSLDDHDGDFGLKHFDTNASRDSEALIPFILAAESLLKSQGKRLLLLATPWSPPAWMKTSGKMDHSGTPCLRKEAHRTWAEYISRWELRDIFLDELERQVPVEVRRSRPGAGAGLPPPDRVVGAVKPRPVRQVLLDISATRDGALRKEVLEPGDGGPPVLQGARVVATIVVADTNKDAALDNRILHGPKEHTWVAGSGTRCELAELAVASMRVGERCVVTCKDPAMYSDAGLGIQAAPTREVEYLLHLREASPTELPANLTALLERAEAQKAAAAERLKEGKVQLALLKYHLIGEELAAAALPDEEAGAGPWGPEEASRARELRRAARLNSAACLLRLQRWAAACEACDAVLESDSRNIKALYRRGQGRLRLGDATAAMHDFETVLDIEPANNEVKQQIEQCQRLLARAADRAQFRQQRRGEAAEEKWR